MRALLLGALTWEPQVKGALYVVIALVVLPGSCYLLLATNTGARLGFQLAAAGFFGFMVIMGVVWWVYGIGPQGPTPTWKPASIVTGDLARASAPALEDFPKSWEKLEITDPAVADSQPVVDAELVGEAGGDKKRFASSSDFLVVAAYKKGGDTYGPLGLNFRPLNVFHKPHYLMVQVQQTLEKEAVAGQPAPRPEVDPAATPVAVMLLRDLGAQRRNPAVATLSSLLIFGLLVYQLHTRDKELMAARSG